MASGQSRKENKNMSLEKNSTKGDSFSEYPTYIKHWEEARPWGWEIRIATESGVHTIHCKWKGYKRPRELSRQERCPHN